jgi:hypothetical protein
MSALIGLVGFIGSGKGTVGDMLHRNYGFEKMSFAQSLKDAAASIFHWDRALLEGDTQVSREWREQPDQFWSNVMGRDFTPREALQKLGTEAGRQIFHPDLWIRSLQKAIQETDKPIVIADVRFENELDFIHNNGGYVIHVQRGNLPDWFSTAASANNGDMKAYTEMKLSGIHESEWGWIGGKINDTIMNNHDLNHLETAVGKVCKNLFPDIWLNALTPK